MCSQISTIISKQLPHIDEHLKDYIIGVVTCDHFESVEQICDAIGEVLYECLVDFNSTDNRRSSSSNGCDNDSNHANDNSSQIMDICDELFNAINLDGDVMAQQKNGDLKKALPQSINLSHMASRLEDTADNWKSIWTSQKEIDSKVDAKKLFKAEAKLKQKAEKRDTMYTEPKPVIFSNKEASASQMMSKKDVKQEARGTHRTKDIKIDNFDVAFGDHVLLKSADLTLVYGGRYGLCGRNGIGKSTLLKMISNGSLFIPSHISILHVEQEVIGDETTALEAVLESDAQRNELIKEEKLLLTKTNLTAEENDRLAYIYQQLSAIEADKAPARASVILSGLGFTTAMQCQHTKQFSGGWRMRIALARALFSRPDLLLLDEPTNMLDMKAIIWLEQYLSTNWESTLLVVSHDLHFLSTVPNEILHFHTQRIDSYRGNYEQFVKSMKEKMKNQQREYEAQQQYRQHVQEFIDKFRYNAKRASLVQSKIKALERLEEVQPVEKDQVVIFRFVNPEQLTPPILQLDEVSFGYDNSNILLNKVNLNANLESRICIVGDNGSGKTTLLKLLNGELNPLGGIRHAHRNLSIGYFSQHHIDQLTMNQSPLQFLASKFPGKPEEHYRRHLGSFGITGDLSLQSLSSLSGGQKSRVAFTVISLLNPHILILDEPTNHLDVDTVDALAHSLNTFKGGVILVTHDQQLIELVCKELWFCNKGSVSCLDGGFQQYRHIIEKELNDLTMR